jgi:hypothetical protein
MLRPGHQVEALLGVHGAGDGAGDGAAQRFSATVTFRDGRDELRQRTYTHDLAVYESLPAIVEREWA